MKISIGIIDDVWSVVLGLKTFLNNTENYTVEITATNGQDFINKLYKGELVPSLMLIDTQMPEMNGSEIVHWLRQYHPNTLLIGLCTSSKPIDRTIMLEAGCCGCINKDETPAQFIKGINEVWNLHYIKENGEDYSKLMLMKDFHTPNFTHEDYKLIQDACTDKKNDSLASSLCISTTSLERKLTQLYLKCDVTGRAGLILKAKEKGWAL
jgi:DNA-binding NarL/FixJ family response regulator